MGYIIRLPGLGMQQDRATLIAWSADLGDSVGEDEVVAEIETEKATFEIEVREDGVLRRTYVEEGEARTPNDPLGIIAGESEDIFELEANVEESGIDIEEASRSETSRDHGASAVNGGTSAAGGGSTSKGRRVSPRARKRAEELAVDLTSVEGDSENTVTADDVEAAAHESSEETRITPRARHRAEELGIDAGTVDGSGPEGAITSDDVEAVGGKEEAKRRVFAAPSVRQLARERGVDIDTLSGSGANGRITESDVRMAADEIDGATSGSEAAETVSETQPSPADRTVREEKPFDGMRRTIADRLSQSYRGAVHVTEHREVDIETLLEAVEAAEDAFDTDISMLDLLLLAVSAALTEHPEFNATFEDDLHRLYEEHNICIAVDVEAGLITPVLRDVETKSIEEVATKRRNLTERALAGDYAMDDLQGGTFTVTNLGVLGIESFDPIINPPQVAILGINAVQERAVPSGDSVSFRHQLPLDLSFDHRVVDGADAARFLGTLTSHIENPWPLLL